MWWHIGLALALIAAVYLYRLDRPRLWADEAQTGIGARSVLRVGFPTAFDGRNAAIIDDGRTLDVNLTFKQLPWVSFYVGAASLSLFGDDAGGLRVLFALLGALAFLPLHALLRRRVRFPSLLATLLLLAPQTVLFQRSARYYPVLILLFTTLAWFVTSDIRRRGTRIGLAVLLFVLLFHSHVGVAMCCGVSVLLFAAFRRRPLVGEYAIGVGAGLLSWWLWYRSLGPALGVVSTQISLTGTFKSWLAEFWTSLVATFVDFDAVGAVPLLLAAGLLGWLAWRRRDALRGLVRDPLVTFILISVLVQSVASAAVFGCETKLHYSMLRYHAHLVVALMLLGCLAIEAAGGQRASRLLLVTAWIGVNLFTYSYWFRPAGRDVPASWVAPVAAELFRPPAEAWDGAILRLRVGQEATAAADRETVVLAMPPWVQEDALFYLGDRYLVPPTFEPDATAAQAAFHRAIGDDASTRLNARPTWVIDSLDLYEPAPDGYELAARYPSRRARPDDGMRPELTRHSFVQERDVTSLRLFRRRD